MPPGSVVGVFVLQRSNRITVFCQVRRAWHPYGLAGIGWAAFRPAVPVRRFRPIYLKLVSSRSSTNPITKGDAAPG